MRTSGPCDIDALPCVWCVTLDVCVAVGQWGDGDVEGGDDVALAREARDKLTRKLEAQREDERNKRKLSDFASAQISGKVRGPAPGTITAGGLHLRVQT